MNRKYWAEKTPLTIMIADKLYQMFPDMHYVHITRDPRDIFCSMIKKNWGPSSLDDFVAHYNKTMHAAWKVRQNIPDENYCVVKLEQLTEKPLYTFSVVLDHIKLPYQDEQLPILTRQIDPANANITRWKDELSQEESLKIWMKCRDIYHLWD